MSMQNLELLPKTEHVNAAMVGKVRRSAQPDQTSKDGLDFQFVACHQFFCTGHDDSPGTNLCQGLLEG
jgi:hypothetical protein